MWDRIAGDEKLSYIDVENMDSQETEDLDEVQVFNEIRKEVGILPVRFGYMPKRMVFIGHELDKEQGRAVLFYKYDSQIIQYSMYMNDTDSSYGRTELDLLTDEYFIVTQNDISVDVKEYLVPDSSQDRYIAEFEYRDAQYQVVGIMEKEEFNDIVKNLYFYK